MVYDGLHRDRPITNHNILAFLPAKAGGGCSTVALNTAGALVNHFGRKVLLVECDRRSGVLSIMLNLQTRLGLSDALQNVGTMTQLEWQQYSRNCFWHSHAAGQAFPPGPAYLRGRSITSSCALSSRSMNS